MSASTSSTGAGLVPLSDRLRWMRVFRLVAAAAILVTAVVVPELQRLPGSAVAAATSAYVVATLGGEGLWRLAGRRGLPLFGLLLMVDGVFLAWATHYAASVGSPLELLVVAHIVTVALLASFRAGVKISLWHSLLIFGVFHAREAGVLGDPVSLGDVEYRGLIVTVTLYSAVAVGTAAFAALNERELRRRRYDLEALTQLARQIETADGPGEPDSSRGRRALRVEVRGPQPRDRRRQGGGRHGRIAEQRMGAAGRRSPPPVTQPRPGRLPHSPA